ncbi:hypothetical protein ONS95_004223 [Cadophora gregata]|uniref:uncharacterized protein n=1 Tax=Cadophora gregata TaxID=51156 RepID=UPI0026DC65CF|nr:uncharacterized protein ONS95_004223 [Cadophora gregata]KAK0105697.1 hypothetical protein ONS95_004223 [Cadophora gregata]
MAQRTPVVEAEGLSSTRIGRMDEPVTAGSGCGAGNGVNSTAPVGMRDSGTTKNEHGTSSSSSGTGSGVKGVLAGIHGIGEKFRGEFNKGVDGAGGDREGVLKNEAVANSGDRERLTGTFAGETKNREGVVPGADGERRF